MTGPSSLRRTPGRAHGFEPLELEGTIPEGLAGSLYRVAAGIVSAVRIQPARACGAVQAIPSTGGRIRRLRNNVANSSAWIWNRQLFALMEDGKPTQLDPKTLAPLAERTLDGVVGRTFSAHPHRVASLGTSFNFGLRFARGTTLDLFALPDGGQARKIGAIELPWATLVHDFVATATHLVFVICPAKLVLWRALLGIGDISQLFEWTPSLGSTLIVVPIAEPERAQPIPCDPYWVWHFANGFRRADELVFDLCRYADFSPLDPLRPSSASPIYHRAVLELRTGRLRNDPALDGPAEFPRVHPAVEGQAHRYAWIHRVQQTERVARFEVETGRLREWVPDGALSLSEPVLVPRPSAGRDEADVWVLISGHDPLRDRSFVAILDGHAPDHGPVAKLWFDQTIPRSFHGSWLDGEPRP